MLSSQPRSTPEPGSRRDPGACALATGSQAEGGLTMLQMTALRRFGWAAAWASTTLCAVSALYLVKSALGVDLLPGPSPLHDLLYPLIRR
jgi:hypothetical protein